KHLPNTTKANKPINMGNPKDNYSNPANMNDLINNYDEPDKMDNIIDSYKVDGYNIDSALTSFILALP
ncbi:8545_t:CDS:1, partial [Gigaspora margarita]